MIRKITRGNAASLLYIVAFGLFMCYAFFRTGLFFRPIQVSASTTVIVLVLVGTLVLGIARRIFLPSWLILAYVFVAYALLTTLWSADPELAVAGTVVLTASVGLMTFVPALNVRWRTVLLSVIAAFGPALYLFGMAAGLGWVTYSNAIQTGMMDSIFQYHNAFGSYELATALIAVTLALTSSKVIQRGIYYMAAITSVVGVAASYSRWVWILTPIMLIAAWLTATYIKRAFESFVTITMVVLVSVVAMTFTISAMKHSSFKDFAISTVIIIVGAVLASFAAHHLFRIQRKSIRYAFGAALVILPIIGGALFVTHEASHLSSIVSRVHSIDFRDASLEGRLWYYGAALHMWLNNPVFGSGFGTWNSKFQAFEQFPYWSTQVHSDFLAKLLDFGIVGFLLWLGLIALMVSSSIRAIRKRNDSAILALAGLLGAVSLFIHAMFDFDMSFPVIQFTFLTLLALSTQHKDNSERTGSYLHVLPLNIGMLVVGSLGATLAISETAFAAAQKATDTNTQLGLYKKAASFAGYNATAHVQLANIYYAEYNSTHSTTAASETWTQISKAVNLNKWDAGIQQGGAVIAYQLGHTAEAYQWAKRGSSDGTFTLKYPSTFMGIALWAGVGEYKNNPQDATVVFNSVVDAYHSIQGNVASLKRVPSNMAQDWSYTIDMPTQMYAATALYCLGDYQTSIDQLHTLSKTGADYDTMGLYEIVSLLDAARQAKRPTAPIPSEMTHKDPTLLREFQLLAQINS